MSTRIHRPCGPALFLLSSLVPAAALAAGSDPAQPIVHGLTESGTRLVRFAAGTPGAIQSRRAVKGLQSGETLLAIDFRPSTGDLLALSSQSRLYVVDPDTGNATQVGASAFSPGLSGSEFGLDFNPVPDRIRLVSDAEQNLRLHPDTGAVAGVDSPLAYAAADANAGKDPNVVAAAYTNSFAGASSTTLYVIDSVQNILATQGSLNGAPVSPNSGQVFTVGALGLDVDHLAGLDISAFGGAFAVLSAPGSTTSQLHTINLSTGAATLVGTVGMDQRIRDIAVAPPAAPRAFAVTNAGTLASFRPGKPGQLLAEVAVTGLAAGESLLGIDFRPANGALYGLGSTSRLYRIDADSGIATALGTGPFTPALTGAEFGFDFNPVPDRVRVVSDAEQNLRLNPNTGAVAAVDASLVYAAGDAGFGLDPNVVGSAYTQNFAGSFSTTLYGIDSARDVLVTQGSLNSAPVSPNSGMLFTVGGLGLDAQNGLGFDVTPLGGAFAAFDVAGAGTNRLYVMNLATGAATFVGTIGTAAGVRDIAVESPRPPVVYGVTADNQLVSFLAGEPGNLLSAKPIKGLGAGETVLGIDFRPATGTLYATTDASLLYVINAVSARALPVANTAFNPVLSGTDFGFDFNPVPDRIRVVSDADQNLRLNPNTGAVAAVDGTLAFAATDLNVGANPNVVAAAYTASFAGSTVTTLYAIDSVLDALLTQGSVNSSPVSPNTGTLFTVGALGIDAGGLLGFDVSPFGGALAAIAAPGATSSQLYTINLATGAATLMGAVGGTAALRDIAIQP